MYQIALMPKRASDNDANRSVAANFMLAKTD